MEAGGVLMCENSEGSDKVVNVTIGRCKVCGAPIYAEIPAKVLDIEFWTCTHVPRMRGEGSDKETSMGQEVEAGGTKYRCGCCGKPIDRQHFEWGGICGHCFGGACAKDYLTVGQYVRSGHWWYLYPKPSGDDLARMENWTLEEFRVYAWTRWDMETINDDKWKIIDRETGKTGIVNVRQRAKYGETGDSDVSN